MRVQLPSTHPHFQFFSERSLIKEVSFSFVQCPKCGRRNYLESLVLKGKFYECTNCQRKTHFSDDKVLDETRGIPKENSMLLTVKEKLESMSLKFTQINSTFYIEWKEKSVPLTIVEFTDSTSQLHDVLHGSSITLYLLDEVKHRLQNAYSERNFLTLYDFFQKERDEIVDLLDVLTTDYTSSKYLAIHKQISNFIDLSWSDFEQETERLLNELKQHEKEVHALLRFCNENKTNPSGQKYVHVGGSYPSDIVPIPLYSYLSKFFEINNPAPGYDTKRYHRKLTKTEFVAKVNSNKGIPIAIIVTDAVTGGVWREVIMYEKAQRNWVHVVIDLDLLIFILFFIGKEKYYQLS